MPDQRRHGLAVGAFGTARDAEQHGHARAIDVGVEHADPRALRLQRQRKVDRCRALAHAALARTHRNNVAYARNELDARLHGVGNDAARHFDGRVRHANGGHARPDKIPDRLELAGCGIPQQDLNGDPPPVNLYLRILDPGAQRGARIGIDDLVQFRTYIRQRYTHFNSCCDLNFRFPYRHGCPPPWPS